MIYTYKNLGRNGRLGNQLWQIAWQIGSADKNNGEALIDKRWDYRSFFSIPDSYFKTRPKGNMIDGGTHYFQELHHWDSVAEKIFEYFQPSAESVDYLHANYPSWFFDSSVNKTSIHVRAGDYLDHPNNFPIPTNRYYLSAIRKVEQTSRLILFSDDIEFAKNKLARLNIKQEILYVDGTPRAIGDRHRDPKDQWDMFLMTYCQQHIIANSTFSWWGAFLAKSNAVYYPSVWWGPNANAVDSRGIDIRKSWVDAMPSHWRKIRC